MLARKPALADLALTTNGVLLADQAVRLRDAGLGRVTVSLDTLDPVRFRLLTRSDAHGAVLDGIDAAAAAFGGLKIDTVVLRGQNDDEMGALIEFARARHAEVRFIEYMDVGGATHWSLDQVVTRREMLARLEALFGAPAPLPDASSAPADRYALPDGTVFGIISSTTEPFCEECDRSRVTADGHFFTCLYATAGVDLRAPLRAGATADTLSTLVRATWEARRDRGAEARLGITTRGAFVPLAELRRNAHLEMHTKGG